MVLWCYGEQERGWVSDEGELLLSRVIRLIR